MRSRRLIFAALLGLGAFLATASASAGEDEGSRRQGILDEFDADGDGRLSGDELEAAREARGERHSHRKRHGKRRQQLLERYDANGDGELSRDERETFRDDRHRRALERFDADGDGELTGDERRAARHARREHRRERWRHHRRGDRRESDTGPPGDADF